MMIRSYLLFRYSRSFSKRSDANSSCGFGGIIPAGNTSKFASSFLMMHSLKGVSIVSMLVKPGLDSGRLKRFASEGLRRSQSISSTFSMVENETAILILVDVFPSSGMAEVNGKIFCLEFVSLSNNEVRTERHASLNSFSSWSK